MLEFNPESCLCPEQVLKTANSQGSPILRSEITWEYLTVLEAGTEVQLHGASVSLLLDGTKEEAGVLLV